MQRSEYIAELAADITYASQNCRGHSDKLRLGYVHGAVYNGLVYGLGINPASVIAEWAMVDSHDKRKGCSQVRSGYIVRVTVTLRKSKKLSEKVDKLYELFAALGGIRQPDGTALFFTGKKA